MAGKRTDKKQKSTVRYLDYSLIALLVFLICFGLVMLYSTSAYSALTTYGDSMYYFKRQLIFSCIGIFFFLFVSRINYHYYGKIAGALFAFALVLMLLVKFSPLGVEVNGARRWLLIPGINQRFQPAEVMKIAVILYIPFLICRIGKQIRKWKGILHILIWGGIAFAGTFYLTENLSTALIVLGITCVLIFVAHPKTAPFIVLATGGIGVLMVGARILGEILESSGNFRLNRLLVWLHPEKYAASGGYQVMQGLYAIGSGGFFGKGLGNSVQKAVIPEVQNDMILSVICEELGVFGAIVILVLFGMLLYRLLFIAQNAPDLYGSLIVTGIFAHIALQVFLNVAVVINLIPTTGITLPFISYGGTSVVFLMIEMGIALGISRQIKLKD
ncbi:MAG: FtsW/RodA/SpoVE family cell cycle protein [Lachnospiraceae bacterium]